ncbi:MAG: BON domain-containing protein [Actinomycetota bacterium]
MITKTVQSDEALAGKVEQALVRDPEVAIHDLRVDVVDGVVRLFGVSSNLQEVRRASELAAGLPGVSAVDNLVAVESPHTPTDLKLREAARAAGASVDSRVEVDVQDGVAILRGEVEHPAMADEVIHAVERVPGVKGPRSEVTSTSLTGHERELRPLLEEALRISYPVPGAVRVAALRDGLVTLEGRVATSEQRVRVLETVRDVSGVHRVESRIRIRPNKPESAQGRGRSGGER